MRLHTLVLALVALVGLAGCSFESDKVMTDLGAAGDEITGFPDDRTFVVEAFDRAKQEYEAFAHVTPQRLGQGIRYEFRFGDASPMYVSVQARKLSENNYLVRYAQKQAGVATDMDESGLVFVRYDGETYYVLTGISSQKMLDRIFAGERTHELETYLMRK